VVKVRGRLSKERVAVAAVHLMPAVAEVQHLAHGIEKSEVLHEEGHLVDALRK
jgi:hypothetical protein